MAWESRLSDEPKFETLGVPTVELVKEIWQAMPYPSTRKVADELAKRGWKITSRTVARYYESDWRPRDRHRQLMSSGNARLSGADAAALARAIDRAKKERAALPPKIEPEPEAVTRDVTDVTPETESETETTSAEVSVSLPESTEDKEQSEFERRDRELIAMSDAALRKLRTRRRVIAEIHVLEAISARAGVAVLAPKETGAMFASLAENETRADKPEIGVPGDGAKNVTPQKPQAAGHGAVLDLEANPPDPAGASIARFRAKLGR